jgi:spore coat polysaccharide biosynthesis protein SpsF
VSRAAARVVAVVQARMSSTRLPGKVLMPLGGAGSVLAVLLARLRGAQQVDEIVVATSSDPADDAVAEAAVEAGVRTVRGPLDDVLRRFVIAADAAGADAVVRITADCPLIDPGVVDELVRLWRDGGTDYVANTLEPRSFPDGLDAEVISRGALTAADREATESDAREHVTPFIRARPDRFSQAGLWLSPPHGDVRMTLDDARDLERLSALVDSVGPDPSFSALMAGLGLERDAQWKENAP